MKNFEVMDLEKLYKVCDHYRDFKLDDFSSFVIVILMLLLLL